jgi:hypothetical protein
MKKLLILAVLVTMFPLTSFAADEEIAGTYKLISSTRKIVDTGETEDSYGKSPNGFMTYGRDGRTAPSSAARTAPFAGCGHEAGYALGGSGPMPPSA